NWGDFGGIRAEASVEYDCLHGMALGMWPCIGDHLHPHGDKNNAVEAMKRNVFKRIQPLAEWIDGATPDADVAVVMPKAQWNSDTLKGAARALGELKVQFEIISEFSRPRKYQLMILPDHIYLDSTWRQRIGSHLEDGGAILSTGWSGLDQHKQSFAMSEWG